MKKRRAQTDMTDITAELLSDLDMVRAHILSQESLLDAWAGVETFCAVALRVMAKTNPSKVRDEARAVNIQVLLEKT